MITAELSTTDTTSDAVPGRDVLGPTGLQTVAMQVVYRGVTSGNFSVVLEAGFDRDGTISYGEVATIDQDDVNNPVALTVAPNLTYRMRHASGVNVTAILG